ncbi:hypothetical protein [Flavobacterium sp. XGLA_31]
MEPPRAGITAIFLIKKVFK